MKDLFRILPIWMAIPTALVVAVVFVIYRLYGDKIDSAARWVVERFFLSNPSNLLVASTIFFVLLLTIGAFLYFRSRKIGKHRSILLRRLHDHQGVLQGLYEAGLQIKPADNPSWWLLDYVNYDEDVIVWLGANFKREAVESYINATSELTELSGKYSDLVYSKLERLKGKIAVLKEFHSKQGKNLFLRYGNSLVDATR